MKTVMENELSRRAFLLLGSGATLSAVLPFRAEAAPHAPKNGPLTCTDIANHFKKTDTAGRVNWDKTTDTFKAGDPARPVRKVAVAWKASLDAVQKAISIGADLLISHESICVQADNSSMKPEIEFALPTEMPKFELIRKAGLVVYRCHDFWDSFPGLGMRASWQKALHIGTNIIADAYPFYVTKVAPLTIGDLARHILKQIKPLRQNGVLVSGDTERVITRIGTGTGVTTNIVKLRELGAEVGIITEDYYNHVRMGVHAQELDFPTITVNHGVTEEWGARNLATYLQQEFPALVVTHLPQYCPYQVIV
ncbi:Nif3-like dinuclear metal center hexameric protein [Larkinella rosea]|nr:Nif3-like dinuclear metal center hexameric protein [Larkinella rosea]